MRKIIFLYVSFVYTSQENTSFLYQPSSLAWICIQKIMEHEKELYEQILRSRYMSSNPLSDNIKAQKNYNVYRRKVSKICQKLPKQLQEDLEKLYEKNSQELDQIEKMYKQNYMKRYQLSDEEERLADQEVAAIFSIKS